MNRRIYHINPIIGLLLTALFIVVLYYILKGLFIVLYWSAPVLLIVLLILDYKILTNHLKKLFYRIRHEPFRGILMLCLNIVGLPFVLGWLVGLALFRRKIRQVEKEIRHRKEGEYADYEIVEESGLELPEELPVQNKTDQK